MNSFREKFHPCAHKKVHDEPSTKKAIPSLLSGLCKTTINLSTNGFVQEQKCFSHWELEANDIFLLDKREK